MVLMHSVAGFERAPSPIASLSIPKGHAGATSWPSGAPRPSLSRSHTTFSPGCVIFFIGS